MAKINEEIIGEETTPEGTLEFGETDPTGQRFERFTPITTEALTPTPTLDFQTPDPETIFPVGDLEIPPPLEPTQPETEATDVIKRLKELTGETIGESAFTAEQEEAAGLPGLQQTQQDLSAQLGALQKEALAIPLQLQQEATGRGITVGGLRPLQTARLRENAIQALTISSLLEASRGNIVLAQQQVDRAVAQKYDPIREEIRAKTANLNLILQSPEYSLAERNRAQRQLDIQNARLDRIAEEEADELEIKNLAIEAANAGADALTLRKIQQAATPEEALILANEVTRAKQVSEFDREMALQGFVKLRPSQLAGLTGAEIIRVPNPITGVEDIYKKPAGKLDTQVIEIGGRKKLINTQTGEVIKDLGITDVIDRDTQVIKTEDGRSLLVDTQTGEVIQDFGEVQPTGATSTTTINNRNITLDNIALPSLDAINQQAQEFEVNGQTGLVVGATETSTLRTREQQQELYDAFLAGGPQAAPPGQSAHEVGMAVDLFPDQGYIENMRPIMEANGWFQTAGAHDKGHFEFMGTQEPVDEFAGIIDLVRTGQLTTKQALEKVSQEDRTALANELAKLDIPADVLADEIARDKAQSALDLKTHKGFDSAVGVVGLGRIAPPGRIGAKQDFIAGVEQLVSGLSLEALIEAKSRGATFGALSDTEMQILASAATRIGTWKIINKKGKVKGYKVSHESMKKELDKINKILLRAIKGETPDSGLSDDEAFEKYKQITGQ